MSKLQNLANAIAEKAPEPLSQIFLASSNPIPIFQQFYTQQESRPIHEQESPNFQPLINGNLSLLPNCKGYSFSVNNEDDPFLED